MNCQHLTSIQASGKDNFDVWKLQMRALLVKNDAWEYVSGEKAKPETIAGDDASLAARKAWEVADRKAHSDLVLAISPSKLKHIVGCETANEVWRKLHMICEPTKSARKTTLLIQLLMRKMEEEEDIQEHIRKFFDAVDELCEMEVEINKDLLTIMLLYSLPPSYKNFRCAIKKLDYLPEPKAVKVKIIDESNGRKTKQLVSTSETTLTSGPSGSYHRNRKRRRDEKSSARMQEEEDYSFECHKCENVGHKTVDCQVNLGESSKMASEVEEMGVPTTTTRESLLKTEETRKEAAENNNGGELTEEGRLPGRIDRMGFCGFSKEKFEMARAGIYEEKIDGIPNVAEIPLVEALSGKDAEDWKCAIQTEFEALIENQKWELVDRPKEESIIGCRIALRNEYTVEGILKGRKAQVVGNSYLETLSNRRTFCPSTTSPEKRFELVRCLMAVAVENNLIVHHLDTTDAFLNSNIKKMITSGQSKLVTSENVFMEVPQLFEEMLPGIISKEKLQKTKVEPLRAASEMLQQIQSGNKVCLMKKQLYGLGHVCLLWSNSLKEKCRSFGLKPLTMMYDDIYIGKHESNVLIVVICIDDILLISNDIVWVSAFKEEFNYSFGVKDLGRVEHFLGMDFNHGDGFLEISQTRFIEDILRDFGMENSKPAATPLDPEMKWQISEELSVYSPDKESEGYPLLELMGRLMNLALGTRPDIIYAVTILSLGDIPYREEHWIAAKRILRYLRGTSNLGLKYEKGSMQLKCFLTTPSSEVEQSDFGIVLSLANSAVAWSVMKWSPMTSFMIWRIVSEKALTLLEFLNGMGLGRQDHVLIFTNYEMRMRDDTCKRRKCIRRSAPSTGMVTDILTKNLAWPEHQECLTQLGMSYIDGKKMNVVDVKAKHCL